MDAARESESTADGARFGALWPLLWLAWLLFLTTPLVAVLHSHPAPPRLDAILAGLALFGAVYLWAAWHNDVSRPPAAAAGPPASWRWLPLAVLTALSVAVVLGDGPRWLDLFTLTAACVGARLPTRLALRAVGVLALLTAATSWLTHDTWLDLMLSTCLAGGIGGGVITLSWAVATSRALRAARAEIARLAVEAERLRFARDLHDLLGHDLAHIALKSELAAALVPAAPAQAMAAIQEMGDVARGALRAARVAVAGYRQPTLAAELCGARELLAAAGIAFIQEGEEISPPPAAEAVLAWAVREGMTNVVKYSRARRCTVRLTQGVSQIGVEVLDDGVGTTDSAAVPSALGQAGRGGSGLPGLAERAAALGGHCTAGPRPGGGFRLAVTLPVGSRSGTRHSDAERPAAPMDATTGGRGA